MLSVTNTIGYWDLVVQIFIVRHDGTIQRRSHPKLHNRHHQLECSASDSSSDEENGVVRRKIHVKHHKHHRRSHRVGSKSSDSDGHRRHQRSESIGKSSDDNHEEAKDQRTRFLAITTTSIDTITHYDDRNRWLKAEHDWKGTEDAEQHWEQKLLLTMVTSRVTFCV
ncbi:hypothetical protein CIPAW_06G014600 [Carya illinoinensis]|uniref:Uncharacterized protein n=2 Tax=Carya illinoinensis TaxID=32201 RepID=A0A8T1Q6V0_CARIL|nr:hypothetical protein CIPAW_06G014600 [Carya illinoinensis]